MPIRPRRRVDQDMIDNLEIQLKHQEEIAERLNMNMESDLLVDYMKFAGPVYNKIKDLEAWIRIMKQCR